MNQPLDTVFNLHKHTEVSHGGDLSLDACACTVFLRNNRPWIGIKLFDSKGKPFIGRVDIENNRLNCLSFCKDFTRVLDALGPGDIRDMYKSVNAVFNADESPEVGYILDLPLKFGADRITLFKTEPWICFGLLQTKGDTTIRCITVSPALRISDGCRTLFVQDISET